MSPNTLFRQNNYFAKQSSTAAFWLTDQDNWPKTTLSLTLPLLWLTDHKEIDGQTFIFQVQWRRCGHRYPWMSLIKHRVFLVVCGTCWRMKRRIAQEPSLCIANGWQGSDRHAWASLPTGLRHQNDEEEGQRELRLGCIHLKYTRVTVGSPPGNKH